MTTKETYDHLLIKPIKRNEIVNEIEYEKILKRGKEIYGIKNDCKSINFLSICTEKNIVNISNSKCLPNLLNSRISTCNTTNNQHIPTIEEISEGVVLLNQFSGNVTLEDETHTLNGTYLIKFHNISLTINNRQFISGEKSTLHALPAILQPTPTENQFKEILSLQMMKNIHIKNTKQLDLLETKNNVHQWFSYGSFIVIAIIVIIFVIKRRTRRAIRITNVTNENQAITDEAVGATEEIEANNTSATTSEGPSNVAEVPSPARRKFYDTSFF